MQRQEDMATEKEQIEVLKRLVKAKSDRIAALEMDCQTNRLYLQAIMAEEKEHFDEAKALVQREMAAVRARLTEALGEIEKWKALAGVKSGSSESIGFGAGV